MLVLREGGAFAFGWGLDYEGDLIIQESQSGSLESKDIIALLALSGVSHGLIDVLNRFFLWM